MLIPVIYPNGRHDMVKDYILTRMIEHHEIIQFKRNEGWVDIKSGNIRSDKRKFYNGPERRQLDPTLPAELTEIFQ